ncbi:MAG: hypothetical protein QXN16_03120 [Candidatus Micrarchaeaceae archaeon]
MFLKHDDDVMQYAVFADGRLIAICGSLNEALAIADSSGIAYAHIFDENRNEVMFIKKR